MGGLSFVRGLKNLRRALALAQGSRLEIRANVSVTKTTQPRLDDIHRLLKAEGVRTITYSLCHSRGGNLRDPAVCDTPTSPPDLEHCAVIEHTLFVDWRGRVFICDHDLHGEHSLGDLMTEPIEAVLARRQVLIDSGMPFKLCRECNDVLKGGFHLFENGVGGILADWIRDLHAASTEPPFSEATPAQRWMLQIYQKENRLDRAVNRLLRIEKDLQAKLEQEEANRETLRAVLNQEIDNRDQRIAVLEAELAILKQTKLWRWRERSRVFVSRLEATARGAPSQGHGAPIASHPVI
jgi:hypothetical protein